MAKPSQREVASVTLGRIARLMQDVTSWSNERVCLAVADEARRHRYMESTWNTGLVRLDELSAWPQMGGLPSDATRGSVVETAQYIRENGLPKGADRLRRLIDAAKRDASGVEQICRALPLIALDHGRLFTARSQRTRWALDDGSHRAVLLALISKRTYVNALIGIHKEAA
jgi:hypothetical protein